MRWDKSGKLLATCSDDSTARIWSLKEDESVHILKGHSREVYMAKWCPLQSSIVATASVDKTVKIWDIETGQAMHTLVGHSSSVYTVAFSPDGQLIASGSFDEKVCIWSVRDGRLLQIFNTNGAIFDLSWNKNGNKVAACTSTMGIYIFDVTF